MPVEHLIVLAVIGLADDMERGRAPGRTERRRERNGGGLYSRQARDAIEDLPFERDLLLGRPRNSREAMRSASRARRSGLEPDVEMKQQIKTLAEQPGTYHQHHGNGDFGNNEFGSEAPPCSSGRAASALFQAFDRTAERDMRAIGNDGKQNSRQQRDGAGQTLLTAGRSPSPAR